MNLSALKKIVKRPKKRLGQGHGSGKGKTGGRGTKGQKARERVKSGFEGGQLPLIKRLPLLRGKLRNRKNSINVLPLSLDKLNTLPQGTLVTVQTLRDHHIIDKDIKKVKLLGTGKLTVALTIQIPTSSSAKLIVEKSGGKVVNV